MTNLTRKWALSLALGLGIVTLPSVITAADDKKGDKPAETAKPDIPTKLPDFSKDYSSSGEISGVVVMADADSVIIQIKVKVPNGKYPKDEAKNLTFKYAEGALARTKVPPMRPDAKGKMVKVPAQELEPRKKPQGAPGLHIDRSELKGGDVVTLTLLRPKSISEKNVTLEDKLIKMAVVTAETTPPSLSREQKEAIENKKKFEKDKADEKKTEEKKK